jgi:predicted oxidoreductase
MDSQVGCFVCGGLARRYINFDYCDEHNPNPSPVPDPERTAEALAKKSKRIKIDRKYGTSNSNPVRSKWL